MIYKFFNKNSKGGAVTHEIMSNQQLVDELHKPIINKFKKCKAY